MIGVDKIYLYNWGDFLDGRGGKFWNKKPYLNYFLEYSDQEIMDFLIEIVSDYKDVSLINWRRDIECQSGRVACQILGYKNCMERYDSKYWMHIDPDEYVLSDTFLTIKDFIKSQDSKYVKFVMGQKIFRGRKAGHPVRESIECNGKFYQGSGATKCIVRNGHLEWNVFRRTNGRLRCKGGWATPMHHPKIKAGSTLICSEKDFRYNHYRGTSVQHPSTEIRKFKGVDQEKFERMSKFALKKKDTSMINFLKRHGKK